MNVETLRTALLYCGIINFAVLLLWAALALLAPGLVRLHSRWFKLPVEQLIAINYGCMLLYELAILMFNIVPYIALRIVG